MANGLDMALTRFCAQTRTRVPPHHCWLLVAAAWVNRFFVCDLRAVPEGYRDSVSAAGAGASAGADAPEPKPRVIQA